MSRCAKLLLPAAGIMILAPSLAVLGWVAINSRDIAASDVSDLVPEVRAVPYQNNAYRHLTAAATSLRRPSDAHSESSLEEWDDAFIGNLLSRNGEVLTLLEQAFACPVYYADNGNGEDSWLHLSIFLAQKAAYERRIGLNDVACESSCGLLRLGTWITSSPRSLAEWAHGVMALRLGLDGVHRLLYDARLSEPELAVLLDRLNQADVSEWGLAQAFKIEFQRVNEVIQTRPLRRANHSLLGVYKFQPNRTRETLARFYRRTIQSIPMLPADVRLPHVAPLQMGRIHEYMLGLRPNRQGRVLIDVALSRQAAPDFCLENKWWIRSHRDGFRLVAACRIYEIRRGRLPETLDALVPELLDEVPRDPYDGKPFRYVRDRALLYSVGEDLKDSLGLDPSPPGAPPVHETAESSDGLDWPEYPSPKPLLFYSPRTNDLVYPIRPAAETGTMK